MGEEVIATCQCGVNTRICIGNGFDETPCYFPYLCKHCRAVVQVNILAKRKRCPQCKSTKIIPYDDPTLSDLVEGPDAKVLDMNKTFFDQDSLTADKNYLCPQCGQMTLHFEYTDMCWD